MHDSVLLETTRQLIVVYVYGSRPKTCVWFPKVVFICRLFYLTRSNLGLVYVWPHLVVLWL
jgi:hypothetical protein